MRNCFLLFLYLSLFCLSIKAQNTPQQLANLWIKAIQNKSISNIKRLIHPKCPPHAISEKNLKRMISGTLPEKYNVEVRRLTGSPELMKKVYYVIPSHQLNLRYITQSEGDRQKYGVGKGFPIGLLNDKWYFTVCLKIKR